ncbi:thiol-disulfide oxidoreductase DCC family protein [Salinicoccus siamensis]|uniref:Thiol-disulfide oxidoreductase DCC family protein n=1 Tax=Salinicoccus siamensis TaxID=381830 RepID=A0ABV5Z532_9STAP
MKRVLLFDSECIFCNKTVHFILEKDDKKEFDFIALNSQEGKSLLSSFNVSPNVDSFFLISDERIYDRSTAALKVAGTLKGVTKLLTVFLLVPRPIRDIVYSVISKNRHKLALKSSKYCKLPSSEDRKRFYI